MNDFVPGVSNLIEGFSLWFLTLICWRTSEEKSIRHRRHKYELFFFFFCDSRSNEHTEGVALPPSTSLAIAGAVHHVAFVVALGKFLVHLIGHTFHDALVWRR